MGIIAPDLSRFSSILNASKAGGGGESIETALAATIGETAERYCMLFYDKSTMVLASYQDVAQDAVAPDLLRLYSREQIEQWKGASRLDNFANDSKIRWVWGYSLTTKQPRLVPASLVYLNYNFDDDEAAIGLNASSGLAAGLTVEEAILVGLYEVVERDAFTVAWLHRKVGPKIIVDEPDYIHTLKTRFNIDHPKVDFQIFDITLDIAIPSVFAMLRRPSEFGPTLCVSSVSRLNTRDAVRKCFRESGQGLPYFRYLQTQLKDWDPKPDYSDLLSFDHHCMLYVKRPELVPKALEFCDKVNEEVLLSQTPNRSTGRVLGDIELCVELLKEQDKEVIVVDITTPDILEVGFRVVRVIIPGLVPLHGDHRLPYFGAQRLFDLPSQLDWQQTGWDPDAGLNPYPHPFP